MKQLLEKVISSLKKEEYKFANEISITYLINEVVERSFGIARGLVKKIGMKKCGPILFIGKNVKIKSKNHIQLGNGITIENNVILDGLSKKGLIIDDNVKIGSFTQIKCSGGLKAIGEGYKIGKNSGIGDYCFFGAAGGIEIGENVIMGQNVRFHSENHNYNRIDIPIKLQGVSNQGIRIGNDCWIGAGAVFLDGINVGDGCVIGANTLVNKDIPSYSVAVGNPVKIIKNRRKLV